MTESDEIEHYANCEGGPACRCALIAEIEAEPATNGGEFPEDRPCAACGKNPAEGFASVWTAEVGEKWYCHGDDWDEGVPSFTCYQAQSLGDLSDLPPFNVEHVFPLEQDDR